MSVRKYVNRRKYVEAIQFQSDNMEEVLKFCNKYEQTVTSGDANSFYINTWQGQLPVGVNDYIVLDENNNYSVLSKRNFEGSYEIDEPCKVDNSPIKEPRIYYTGAFTNKDIAEKVRDNARLRLRENDTLYVIDYDVDDLQLDDFFKDENYKVKVIHLFLSVDKVFGNEVEIKLRRTPIMKYDGAIQLTATTDKERVRNQRRVLYGILDVGALSNECKPMTLEGLLEKHYGYSANSLTKYYDVIHESQTKLDELINDIDIQSI